MKKPFPGGVVAQSMGRWKLKPYYHRLTGSIPRILDFFPLFSYKKQNITCANIPIIRQEKIILIQKNINTCKR